MKIDSNSVVAITGASKGIGKEAALAFAKRGASVILLARDETRLNEVAEDVKSAGGKAMVIALDVSKEDQCRSRVAKALSQFGQIDVLVNNAGYGHYASADNLTTDVLQKIFHTNLYGAIWCSQAVLPHMKERKRGHIVNVSTIVSLRSIPFMTAYCMTKFAMNAFNEGLLLEVRKHGIGVSLVCPGLTKTDFQTNATRNQSEPLMRSDQGMSAEKVGRAILKAVECNRRRVYLTAAGKLLSTINRISPWVVDEIIYRKYG